MKRSTMATDILQTLRDAIATGRPNAIQAALPEPPAFLPALFAAAPSDRNAIIAGVLPALEMDEDRWVIIEAAAQDTVARPEQGAFLATIPLIPAELIPDARKLAATLSGPAGTAAVQAINVRAAELGVALGA